MGTQVTSVAHPEPVKVKLGLVVAHHDWPEYRFGRIVGISHNPIFIYVRQFRDNEEEFPSGNIFTMKAYNLTLYKKVN